jgi:hypothetical protein
VDEPRTVKYGRNLAIWIKHTVQSLPENNQEGYKSKLIKELKNYSFERKGREDQRNSGCKLELENITECKIEDPTHLARLVKEGIHLMYQKDTARRVLNSLINSLYQS